MLHRPVIIESALMREVSTPQKITVELDRGAGLALIGCLQLALRHPGCTGAPAEVSLRFIATITKTLPPAMRETIAMGFDAAFDQEAEVAIRAEE